eukprot:CAMPEP_0202726794 /NCGR_PEP_ID=MMETSP1385-20130828/184793_1 /ASSEMBLY_ACC=CAM_ASM_000861 /TAXON_ID=933848 /ORGANISM="Elphidium margaritaceum" /LENGTH=511 /DNA_ID=CAMNT_0049393021 /DNA_START=40 /DNA_END=1575 /DNA_ORIENTATION=-
MPVKKTRSRRAQKAESPPPSSSDEQLPENDDEQPEQSGNASKRKNKTYVRRSPESVDVSPTVSKKRSSPRLKRLREMNENENENASDADENDGDEDEDSVVGRRRGRAIKPPPAKKRRTVPLYRKQCTPSFVDDDELLLELGVAYISKKTKGARATRKKRISYHESVEVDGHVYEYHKNGKYELVRVQAHKIEFEEADSEWYRNVQFKKLRKFMGRRHDESGDDEHKHGADMDENENGSDGDGGDDDALTFGELVFECEWKGWGDTTWESWDTLKENVVFEGRAIKPPPAKKRRTLPLYRKQCTPSFIDDDELLLELGVAYISKKTKGTRATRKKRISYHESVEVDGHVYEYHKNGKYELVRVQAHKIEFEEADSEWYRNVQFKKLRKFMGRRHDESGDDEHKHGADMDENENGGSDGDDDALTFGELVFECEWKGWGDTTWESWDTLKENVVFEEYCAAQHWDMAKPMQCRLDAHSPEDVKRVLLNMAIFGDHHTRKAMKILLCENMNMW